MDTFAMGAIESAEEWAARLSQKQLECRGWGHRFPRRRERQAERVSNGGLRWHQKCNECQLPLIYTYYPFDDTYTSVYIYSDPRFKDYSRKGHGPLNKQQRGMLRRMAMGL